LETLTQEDEARYRALCERIRAWHREHAIPFDFPSATEEQVRETEAKLGISLPPLLRMLYTEVANGGRLLSPNYWFFGVGNGWPDTLSDDYGRKVGRLSRSGWRLHLCMAQALERFPGYTVFTDTRPERFLMLGDQLGITSIECDLPTGRIFLTGPGPEIPTEDPREKPGWLTRIECMASSLENYLNTVFDGTFYNNIQAGRNLTEQDIDSYVESSCSDDLQSVWRGLYHFSPDFFTQAEPDLEEWDIDGSALDLSDS
jgi:hypothetical protein